MSDREDELIEAKREGARKRDSKSLHYMAVAIAIARKIGAEPYADDPDKKFSGVEVGVHRGLLSSHLLAAMPRLKLMMIDNWEGRPEVAGSPAGYRFKDQAINYRAVQVITRAYYRRAAIWPFGLQTAVDAMTSLHVDFVYLDPYPMALDIEREPIILRRMLDWLVDGGYLVVPQHGAVVRAAFDRSLFAKEPFCEKVNGRDLWFIRVNRERKD